MSPCQGLVGGSTRYRRSTWSDNCRVSALPRYLPAGVRVSGPVASRAMFAIPAAPPLPLPRPALVRRSTTELAFSWAPPDNYAEEDVDFYELWAAEDPRAMPEQARPAVPDGYPANSWAFKLRYSGAATNCSVRSPCPRPVGS